MYYTLFSLSQKMSVVIPQSSGSATDPPGNAVSFSHSLCTYLPKNGDTLKF